MGKCIGKRRRQGPASHGVHGKQDSYLKSPQKSKLHSHFGPLRSRLTVRGEYMQAAGIRQYVDEFTLECGHRSQALNQALRWSPCLAQHAMARIAVAGESTLLGRSHIGISPVRSTSHFSSGKSCTPFLKNMHTCEQSKAGTVARIPKKNRSRYTRCGSEGSTD
jgi:hypothetical protein